MNAAETKARLDKLAAIRRAAYANLEATHEVMGDEPGSLEAVRDGILATLEALDVETATRWETLKTLRREEEAAAEG